MVTWASTARTNVVEKIVSLSYINATNEVLEITLVAVHM